MRLAILSPWFLVGGGGTKVIDALAEAFPQADFFTLFYKPEKLPKNLRGRNLRASFLNQIPFIDRLYRPLLPLHPLAAETLDLRNYDTVISCDASVMKGIIAVPGTLHVCYCHTPTRYAWDLHRTFADQAPALLRPMAWLAAHRLRQWDYLAAQRVDQFVANSHYIARRIYSYYRRPSTVVYPPVDTSAGYIADRTSDYYLSVGRLTHTKRLDIAIEACNKLRRRFVIVGAGREEARLKAMAGPTIEFTGHASAGDLLELYARCRAFLFAADEDFGIAPVEAQSFGRPVIAFGHGGALETIIPDDRPNPTGVFFPEQTAEALAAGILRFEKEEHRFCPETIRENARRFDRAVFMQSMRKYITRAKEMPELGMERKGA